MKKYLQNGREEKMRKINYKIENIISGWFSALVSAWYPYGFKK